jgi:hypothetical protein
MWEMELQWDLRSDNEKWTVLVLLCTDKRNNSCMNYPFVGLVHFHSSINPTPIGPRRIYWLPYISR